MPFSSFFFTLSSPFASAFYFIFSADSFTGFFITIDFSFYFGRLLLPLRLPPFLIVGHTAMLCCI